ncbi:uncharacterized protein F5Z01DRAFT_266327 [Emericellopsis atlantica]|uniref:Suppressor of anucleate metulae protein B n=1 Tax=Emericellopsis atlantica TaxID=2614577 RepID=A0A9P7ZGL3_9HYPO|nr:uncharacterized protein F5Z01DRAFT_266327 [Emericellopsis atlantica]KAG9251783.1 hypothetical protein F5Z01DRAFT_266327 [Emericellopsis atlantica]
MVETDESSPVLQSDDPVTLSMETFPKEYRASIERYEKIYGPKSTGLLNICKRMETGAPETLYTSFANEDIATGQAILTDHPLFFVDDNMKATPHNTQVIKNFSETLHPMGRTLLKALPNVLHRQPVSKQYALCKSYGLPIRGVKVPFDQNMIPTEGAEQTDNVLGVFPFIARFIRHSCTPNAVAQPYDYKGRMSMVVRALQPIQKGKAIFIDYFDCGSATYNERQEMSVEKMGELCYCQYCCWQHGFEPHAFASRSAHDVARSSIQQMLDDLCHKRVTRPNMSSTILKVRGLMRIVCLEHGPLRMEMFRAAADLCLQDKDYIRAKYFLRMALEIDGHINGRESKRCRLARRLFRQFEKSLPSGVNEELAAIEEGAPRDALQQWLYHCDDSLPRPSQVSQFFDLRQNQDIIKTIDTVPWKHSIDHREYVADGEPRTHWMIIVQVDHWAPPNNPSYGCVDHGGKKLDLWTPHWRANEHAKHKRLGSDFSEIKVGVVLYPFAVGHGALSTNPLVHVQEKENLTVLPIHTIKELMELNDRIQRYCPPIQIGKEHRNCFGCYGIFEKTMQCSRCGFFRFCDKECFNKAWPRHKQDCDALSDADVRELFLRDWRRFEAPVEFSLAREDWIAYQNRRKRDQKMVTSAIKYADQKRIEAAKELAMAAVHSIVSNKAKALDERRKENEEAAVEGQADGKNGAEPKSKPKKSRKRRTKK